MFCTANNIIERIPDSIIVGGQDFHVQGIAIDKHKGCAYFSFTTRLIKTDLNGNIIGSVDGLEGHLGAIAFNPDDGNIYASFERKDDEIGNSITKKLGAKAINKNNSVFYIAIFDGDKIQKEGMNPNSDEVMHTVRVLDAIDDYKASVTNRGKTVEHRYGCSGIDGIMFAPLIGSKDKKTNYLYVGYGIYGDTTRIDNDYQILLCYDQPSLEKHKKPVMNTINGADDTIKPLRKFFLMTGNTTYGVQNMTYDSSNGNCLLFVYPGKKSAYPNYSLFAFNIAQKPMYRQLENIDNPERQWIIELNDTGNKDESSGISGWNFKWGSTGICHLDREYFYISVNGRDDQGKEFCKAILYKWTGDKTMPFVRQSLNN